MGDYYDGLDSDTFGTKKTESTEDVKTNSYESAEWNQSVQTAYGAGEAPRSKALDVCALAAGILSIVCCYAYGGFGLIGLVLSIMCLVTGRKSGFSIAGLICSLVGLTMTIFLFTSVIVAGGLDPLLEKLQNTTEVSITQETTNDSNLDSTSVDAEESTEVVVADDDTNDGYNSSQTEIVFYGKKLTIPCSFTEVENMVTIDQYSLNSYEKGVEPGATAYLSLTENDKVSGITLILRNKTDKLQKEFSKMELVGVLVDSWSLDEVLPDVEFEGKMRIGMSQKDVEAYMKKIGAEEPNVYEDSVFYSVYSKDYSHLYNVRIDSSSKRVDSIELYYFE